VSTAAPGPALRARRPLLGRLLPAGVGVAGAGVVLAIAGVIAGPLFVPGTWIILVGMLALAAAGLLGATETRGDAG
jgi:hypothetical protein